jgi:hypothetical protein
MLNKSIPPSSGGKRANEKDYPILDSPEKTLFLLPYVGIIQIRLGTEGK